MPHSPEQVLPRIFAALDDRRFDDLRALYVEAVQADTAIGRFSSVGEVIEVMRRVHEPIPAFQHQLSGVVVDVDDAKGEATVRANVTAIFCDGEQRPAFEAGSVWRGRLRRDADGWRVTEFAMPLVWSRGHAATLA